MAYANLKKRINKLQHGGDEKYSRILDLIAQGAFFDELSPGEQSIYLQYKQSLGGCDTEYAAAYLDELLYKAGEIEGTNEGPPPEHGFYHYRLSKRRPPPTEEELEERQREVAAMIEEIEGEYNSPEAKAKRKAEYEELQEIGRLRGEAMARGERMDTIPLPWEKGYKPPEYYRREPERKKQNE